MSVLVHCRRNCGDLTRNMHLKKKSEDRKSQECLNDLGKVEKASILLCNFPRVLLVCIGQS